MVVSRTPFRVSFLGGGTDFPSFYSKHGGCCIATSIDKYSYEKSTEVLVLKMNLFTRKLRGRMMTCPQFSTP